MIERLPKMEEELSLLLNGIQVIRRLSQEIVMAQDYEVLLNRMLNSVRRSQEDVLRGFRMEDLSHLVMVVERSVEIFQWICLLVLLLFSHPVYGLAILTA